MREGASSEVKYNVQSGGRTIKTNYDDLKANKGYYKRQTRRYNRQVNQEKGNAFLTILFIVLMAVFAGNFTALEPTSPITNQVEAQDYISDIAPEVAQTAVGSIETLMAFVTPIAEGIQFLVNSFNAILNATLKFIGFFAPFDDLINQCVDFDSLTFLQQANYDATYGFWRLFNPDTPESVYQANWATNQGFNGVCQ